MLEIIIPHPNYIFENESDIYIQQDSTSLLCQYEKFCVAIRQRGSATEFMLSSPYLTLLDFYLWVPLKNTMYATKSEMLEELRDEFEHAINFSM
jgi:hypothetical protein